MRFSIALLLLVLPLVGSVAARADDAPANPPRAGTKAAKLQVSIDRSKVDLVNHRLEVTLSRRAEKVVLKVFGESGAVLADVEQTFGGTAPGTPLVVTWQPKSSEKVARIEVWGHDTLGYYAGIAMLPWSINIPHEEVNFQTDSDVIRPTEFPKLAASSKTIADAVGKHKDLGPITLYIAGHSDTVGSTEHNLALSRRRARSIATWFRSQGLKIRIAFEGFGESAPLVKTADEVDEPQNRRVDYILAFEPPKLPAGSTMFSWMGL